VGIHAITGTFFMDGNPNNEGIGSPVRNNAASMSDGSPQCSDIVWTLPNGEGLGDELWPENGTGPHHRQPRPRSHRHQPSDDPVPLAVRPATPTYAEALPAGRFVPEVAEGPG
jgi:hypothetical protein